MRSVVQNTVTVEMVEVKDATQTKPHYLALTTTRKSTEYFHDDGRLHWSSATIDLDAVYFAGPVYSALGQHICLMGGSTQYGNRVKLTNGGVVINIEQLKGLHIGSLMFSRIVAWAQQFPSDWCVVPIRLSVIDARTPEAKERRNQFYRHFGIDFDFRTVDGIEEAEGSSRPDLTVGELLCPNQWDNIQRLGHWGTALTGLLLQLDTSREKLRRARFAAQFRKQQLVSLEHRLRQVGAGITWPLVALAGGLGYAAAKLLG